MHKSRATVMIARSSLRNYTWKRYSDWA